jgi:hypothetical protein
MESKKEATTGLASTQAAICALLLAAGNKSSPMVKYLLSDERNRWRNDRIVVIG